jgi:ferredoxin-thioredoxin reductase catalytic subunit
MGIQSIPLDSNPTGADEEVYNAQRAFTLGLVSGMVARQRNYRTPFCVVRLHNGKCEQYDADGNLKKTEATDK